VIRAGSAAAVRRGRSGDHRATAVTRAPVRLTLVVALLAAGCGSPGPATPPATAPPTLAPTTAPPTLAPTTAPASLLPTPPPGTALVDVPAAGIRLPVPVGWERFGSDVFTDPAGRDALAATYPGSRVLIGAVDELGGRSEPVFLAADPSPASLAGPLASNLSVLVSQPSVGGFLLDLVAGFIGDGLTEALGATEDPARDRVTLPAGEAVRLRYVLATGDGMELLAVAWVIGAPAGTLLVTLMGTTAALGDLDPDALAGAIVPIPAP